MPLGSDDFTLLEHDLIFTHVITKMKETNNKKDEVKEFAKCT